MKSIWWGYVVSNRDWTLRSFFFWCKFVAIEISQEVVPLDCGSDMCWNVLNNQTFHHFFLGFVFHILASDLVAILLQSKLTLNFQFVSWQPGSDIQGFAVKISIWFYLARYLLDFLKNHARDSFSNIFLFSIYLCPSLSGQSLSCSRHSFAGTFTSPRFLYAYISFCHSDKGLNSSLCGS